MKICVVCSTNGGILSRLIENSLFKESLHSIISDRNCGAQRIAENNGIPFRILYATRNSFSDELLEYLKINNIDFVFSFFTKVYTGDLLQVFKNRIINVHPSILPSFPGLNSFKKSILYGSKFVGSTVHFIDFGVDTGPIIIQSSIPNNLNSSFEDLRHQVFIDQCRITLQAFWWIKMGKIIIKNEKVVVENANFHSLRYSPGLDWIQAINFN